MAGVPSLAATSAERDRFVLSRRPPRARHDPWLHQGVIVEDERAADGRVVEVATVFLTGRECPWRCVMCDLWQHTVEDDTPPGALAHQLDAAIETLRVQGAHAQHVKLYNAGSFFDPRAVPEQDYRAIARRAVTFSHVIVESHPLLIGPRLPRFQNALARAADEGAAPSLEVAMGLETAHPDALRQLHKRFSLDEFSRAAEAVLRFDATLRVFLLVGVPFIRSSAQQEWIQRSVAYAFDRGASVVSLIPTRPGNGTVEALAAAGAFEPPSLGDLERALEQALPGARGRVFADTWDLDRFSTCAACVDERRRRLHAMNVEQRVRPAVTCAQCATALDTA